MPNAPSPEADPPQKAPVRPPIRWWPLAIMLLLAAGTWFFWARSYGGQQQDRNIATAVVVLVTVFLFLIWCLCLSRLPWKTRWSGVGGVVGLIVLVAALFRIRGVSGDLVPLFEWRWARSSAIPRERQTKPGAIDTAAQRSESTNDYPQFLGPQRNATVAHPGLARDWQTQPPQRLWRKDVGAGWSGFAIVGNRAITQEQQGEDETVVCYDLLSGELAWSHTYPAHFQSALAGEGPRATPTVAGRRVFALGSTGILSCLDLETGKPLWSKDIVGENQAKVNEWGMSGSPLVVDDLVIASAGGGNDRSLVAYRAATGEFVWGGGSDGAGYSSPIRTILAGVPQILIFNSGGISAHDPATGTNLWKYHWPGGHPHVSTPVVLPDDRVLVSSGYGVGSELLKIQKDSSGRFSAGRIWKSNRLKAKFTDLVYRDGFIYGLDDGIMACLDASNGEQKWKAGRYGHGQEILVADLLLITAESGEVILLDANPQEARELSRFSALRGKTWNPPALAGQYLLVRNDKEAACYRLPLAKP